MQLLICQESLPIYCGYSYRLCIAIYHATICQLKPAMALCIEDCFRLFPVCLGQFRVITVISNILIYIYVSVNLCNQAIRELTENFRQFVKCLFKSVN